MKLNLGCGRSPLSDYINLDLSPGAEVVHDLETVPLPFPDNYFDELRAHHTLEHIRNILPLMQDLWRITKPNGTFEIVVPYGSNDAAYEDPTHVRFFFHNSFAYFSQTAYGGADYNYRGDWSVVERHIWLLPHMKRLKTYEEALGQVHGLRNVAQDFMVILRAVKPARTTRSGLETPRIRLHIKEPPNEVPPARPA